MKTSIVALLMALSGPALAQGTGVWCGVECNDPEKRRAAIEWIDRKIYEECVARGWTDCKASVRAKKEGM